MSTSFSHILLLRVAGLFTWACVGIVLIALPMLLDQPPAWRNAEMVWVCQLAFGASYWFLSRRLTEGVDKVELMLLVILTASSLGVSFFSREGLGGILLLVVSGVLPWIMSFRFGLLWLVGQNVALGGLMYWTFDDVTLSTAMLYSGLFLGYSSFTFIVSLVARRQARAREELRKVNSELRATQALLAESTRIAERARISRELHDLVGHHLTALSLNLEVASHLVKGKAQEHVRQSQSLAKLLLSDVREVVSNMRRDDAMDLSQALRSLSEGVPRPQVHLSIPDEFAIDDPRKAQVLLRCAQEIITNTVKHANAENLWLTFRISEDALEFHARDDGRGVDELEEGNGLTGMGERLGQLGGRLAVKTSSGEGFSLDAWMPLEATI